MSREPRVHFSDTSLEVSRCRFAKDGGGERMAGCFAWVALTGKLRIKPRIDCGGLRGRHKNMGKICRTIYAFCSCASLALPVNKVALTLAFGGADETGHKVYYLHSCTNKRGGKGTTRKPVLSETNSRLSLRRARRTAATTSGGTSTTPSSLGSCAPVGTACRRNGPERRTPSVQ